VKKISDLMKNVSLRSIDNISDEDLKEDEIFMVFYEDDESNFDVNKKVSIAGSILQLDAALTYAKRKVSCVKRLKVVEVYS
jgi:hypothetical protein